LPHRQVTGVDRAWVSVMQPIVGDTEEQESFLLSCDSGELWDALLFYSSTKRRVHKKCSVDDVASLANRLLEFCDYIFVEAVCDDIGGVQILEAKGFLFLEADVHNRG
jgi:hypothetical protein